MKDMKKKALLFLATCFTAFSCENKELGMSAIESAMPVRIEFDWQGIAQSEIPTSEGMRVNIFSADNSVRDYGVDDISYTGGTVNLINGAEYMTLAYTYQGNNIYFRNESDRDLIEAYCNAQTRTTYTRAFPDEDTYDEPKGLFYTGKHDKCVARSGEIITIAPESKLYKYTFEIRDIEGAEFISETRGAISGMSRSFFIRRNQVNPVPATVLFNATVDKVNGKITGSFRTFGRLDAENNFTIEILYPSNTGGIVHYTWDVTGQINQSGHFSIVIDNSGIAVPDEGGDAASGWQVDVDDWNDQTVPLN
ncbi:MAG: DUF5119 domain-containing protein [Prevotella sp.]|jgi:hypothetical protein|nr:DUF5119 domain-containing protein [Prevotella sp.]